MKVPFIDKNGWMKCIEVQTLLPWVTIHEIKDWEFNVFPGDKEDIPKNCKNARKVFELRLEQSDRSSEKYPIYYQVM